MKQYLALNIFTLFAFIALVSCKSTQPIKEVTDTKITNYDSIFHAESIKKNLAIIDSLTIKLGQVKTDRKECDSVCQIAIDRLLSQVNTSKKSGTNSYGMSYNEKDKSLNFNTQIGETENSAKVNYRYIGLTKTIYSHKDIPVDKPLPRWQLILMIIGAATIGYFIIKIITFIRSKTI